MKFYDATGKNVKEAIKAGCAQLGCDADDVEIQVLEMGSPGLFGMFGKPAKVRLTLKKSDSADEIEMPTLSLDSGKRREKPRTEAKPAPKPEKKPVVKPAEPEQPAAQPEETEAEAQETGEEAPRPARKRRRSRGKGGNKPQQSENAESNEEIKVEPIEQEPFVETPEEELTDTAKTARAFLKELTEKMNVPAEIAVSESEEQLKMVLSGENMSILIGRRGETLDALQYLTSLNVNRGREDYLRVSLDTENYRAKREEALRKLAIRKANSVKKSGRRVALEPMNPYERRILHSALQADPDVTTHSEGEEPYRRVIITLNNQK